MKSAVDPLTTPFASSMVGGVNWVSEGDVYSTFARFGEEPLVPCPGLLGLGMYCPVIKSTAWWVTGAPAALKSW